MLNRKMISSVVLALCLALTTPSVSFADATGNSNRGKNVVTLGANLSSAEQKKMINYFKADPSKCKVIYVTNAEERAYMSPSAQPYVGDRALSCAYVKPTQKGGIRVHIANLTWVTASMIANTLTTCGITNCDVVAASPIQCAGTGALTGIMKAYETTTGKQLQPRRKKLACREMDVTARVGNRVGKKRAQRVVTRSKLVCMKKKAKKTKDVKVIVSNTEKEFNVALSASEKKELINLLIAIMQEDYENVDEMIDVLEEQDAGINGDSSDSSDSKTEKDGEDDSSDSKEKNDQEENTEGEETHDTASDSEGEENHDIEPDFESEDIQEDAGNSEDEENWESEDNAQGEDNTENDDILNVNDSELISEDQEEIITSDSEDPEDDPVDEDGNVIPDGVKLVDEDGVIVTEEDKDFNPEEETFFPVYEEFIDDEDGWTEESDSMNSESEAESENDFVDTEIADESDFEIVDETDPGFEDEPTQEENWEEVPDEEEFLFPDDEENLEFDKEEMLIDQEQADSLEASEKDSEDDGWIEVDKDWTDEETDKEDEFDFEIIDTGKPEEQRPEDTDGWNQPEDLNPSDTDGWSQPEEPSEMEFAPQEGFSFDNPSEYQEDDRFEDPMDMYPEDTFDNPMDNYPDSEDDFDDPMDQMSQGIQLNTDADCADAFVRASFGRESEYEQALIQNGYDADHSVPTLSGDLVDSLAREIASAVSSNSSNFSQLQSQMERIFGMTGAPSGAIGRANLTQEQREDSFYATMSFMEDLLGGTTDYSRLQGNDMDPSPEGNDNYDNMDNSDMNNNYDMSYDDSYYMDDYDMDYGF